MTSKRVVAPYVLILPSFVLAALIVIWPVNELAQIASHSVNRFGQLRDFVGMANFRALLDDPNFIASLWRTGIWTLAVVGGAIICSVPVALVLNEDFYGRDLARVIVMLPWALIEFGIIDQNIQWLAEARTAFPMQILIGILVTIPFTVTIILGGLSSIPDDLYEAAALEGAGRWDQFRHITLPLIAPFLNIALVLNTIYVFNSFPIIWAMTQGGPANSTDILVTYLYKVGFRLGKLGEASAVSLVMFGILLVFTLIYVRLTTARGAKA